MGGGMGGIDPEILMQMVSYITLFDPGSSTCHPPGDGSFLAVKILTCF